MKNLSNLILLTSLLLASSLCGTAQEPREMSGSKPNLSKGTKIPADSRIFITPMDGNLDGFIAAELVKKKLPIIVVTDEATADYVITGASIKADDKWYHSVFDTGKDKNEGNIQVIDAKNKSMIWAGEAGDRSMLWGNLKRGSQRRVADRLVDKLKKDLF